MESRQDSCHQGYDHHRHNENERKLADKLDQHCGPGYGSDERTTGYGLRYANEERFIRK